MLPPGKQQFIYAKPAPSGPRRRRFSHFDLTAHARWMFLLEGATWQLSLDVSDTRVV